MKDTFASVTPHTLNVVHSMLLLCSMLVMRGWVLRKPFTQTEYHLLSLREAGCAHMSWSSATSVANVSVISGSSKGDPILVVFPTCHILYLIHSECVSFVL